MGDRITIGNVEVLCLTDAAFAFPLPLTTAFPTSTDEGWVPMKRRYPETFDAEGHMHVHFGCYLVRSAGRTVLVDTGLGAKPIAMFGGARGVLPEEMVRKQVDPGDIDTVFHTHLHFDHVGWNVGDDGKPRFANARYVCGQADWDFFQLPEIQAGFPPDSFNDTLKPLAEAGVIDLLDGETVLSPELTAIPTPGHTPGHMSLLISSAGERAIITGDSFAHPAHVTEPDWAFMSETDPPQAAATRYSLLDRMEAEDMKMIACHFPSPGFGQVIRLEGKRFWQGA